jgi:PAS domain S-box-containing protein
MFQEFPFHEEKRWPYNPGMAPVDGRSAQVPALDARHVVDAIPGLAWSSRPDGSVEFFNGRWYEYTGLSAEESLGWGWKAAVHGEDIARLLDWWATRDAEGGRECEVRLRRSDGDFQWFLLRHEPLCDPTGAVVRWYGTWINIEDSKQKELLGVAGKRALEMIADGASLSEILNELCCVIDVYASATSQVLLMDRAGHQLLPLAGPNFTDSDCRPGTLAGRTQQGLLRHCSVYRRAGHHFRYVHRPALASGRSRGGGAKARSGSRATCRLVGTSDFELW